MFDENKRRKALLRHIDNVRDNCILLGERLIEKGEVSLGHSLIANGYVHDQSKFHGAEWLYLNDETQDHTPNLFKAAHTQHVTINKHHSEAWSGGIKEMDRLHLAEMVCDWKARSSEFGDNFREWIKKKASKRYGFSVQSKVYKEIKYFVDLLLDSSFDG